MRLILTYGVNMSLLKIAPISSTHMNFILRRSYSNALSQIPSPLPTIKVPKYVENYIEKQKKKQFANELNLKNRRKIAYRGDTTKPVIASSIGEYNHYLGQIYNERYVMPMQSKYWFKTKSSGQKFTINRYDSNPSLMLNDPEEYVDDLYLPNEFSKTGLTPNMVDTLIKNFNFSNPTRIQTLVIPRLLTDRHMIIASETGAGKTISYLAPIIDQLSIYKKTTELHPDTPLGLILVPGRELAEQIADVAYNLGLPSGISVKVLISEGTKLQHLRLRPNTQVDLIVASIGTLVKLFSKNKMHLANLKYLVLDEADTLLDGSFIKDMQYLMQRLLIKLSGTNFGTQLILSSSIYPSNIEGILGEELEKEDFVKVCSPYLHRIPPHVQQKFLRVDNDSRAGEVLALVKEDYKKKKPVLIFCNKFPACDWMSLFLAENGIPNAKFHSDVEPKQRSKNFHDFQRGIIDVLCCTDLASRGLDTQRVKHVINFDFPNNVSDYLLRIGRVGRVGSNHGQVTSLVVAKSGVHTVNDIEKAVRMSERISNVDSNIKQKIINLYFTH